MASSKVMKSSNTRNSDLSRRSSSTKAQQQQQQQRHQSLSGNNKTDASEYTSTMTVDGILRDAYNATTAPITDATLLDAQITLMETSHQPDDDQNGGAGSMNIGKTVDEVWKEIVAGDKKEMKEEAADEMMTLEDFLVKAGAVDEDQNVKAVPNVTERLSGGLYAFDPPPSSFQVTDKVEASIMGFGNGVEVIGGSEGVSGRGKRGRVMLEPLDKAAQQRQRRMIKNRESAARSRERKQAYQVELESMAVRLEEENEQLLKEKAERTKERYKQLMEKVVPVVEKQRREPRSLRRVRSLQW